ncbi:hypothetical protein JKP88DRAFT_268149 [Tribonema minus]|uniref:AAA+ ATPase domain-containing protein n=1 Tax=Tribonema minus TaxID=303371 RepID=A0A835Z2D0_9STRA|nr:hypothetical protein JKP88DRAFT_268149 [Tribonema minus]
MKQLHYLFTQRPHLLNLVMGPPDCGKTALLEEYIRKYGDGGGIGYINCRLVDATTPTSFAAALASLGKPALLERLPASVWTDELGAWFTQQFMAIAAGVASLAKLKFDAEGEAITFDFNAAIEALRDLHDRPLGPSSVAAVLTMYNGLLDIWEKARKAGRLEGVLQYPVLVIDEANVLTEWSKADLKDLRFFFRFFIAITKESSRGHVLLATADYAFQTWLTRSLRVVVQNVRPGVISAKQGGDGWTPAKFADAALLLLDSEHNVATLKDMKMRLGRHISTAVAKGHNAQAAAGGQAVAALIRANILSQRPYSEWSQDIPPDAYGPPSSDPSTIITAYSAVNLYCMRGLREDLEKTINE